MLAEVSIIALLTLAPVKDSTRTRARGGAVTCQAVSSLITAEAVHVGPALTGLKIKGTGTSKGDLPGTVSLEIFKPFIGKELDVAFRIRSAYGEMVARGSATTHRDSVA